MENNWLNLINLLRRNLIWTDIIFNEFIKQTSSEFDNLEKKNNTNISICKYKTEGVNLTDFGGYEKLIDSFKILKDRNINPKEVLKNQISFKSDQGEIKKGTQI